MNLLQLYENEDFEFKEMISDNSLTYLKTVVAFANSHGGLIIFGVRDSDHKVVGIEDNLLFVSMDRITNAITDSIESLPDFCLSTVQESGKNLIVLDVKSSIRRPYYIKSLGYEKGCFMRVGGTTRLVDKQTASDWYFETRNESWDSFNYNNHEISNNEMKEFHRLTKGMITEAMMRSWNLIYENNDKIIASNAFALLCGFYKNSPLVHCAVFRSKEKGEFLDKKILEGSLIEVYENAVKFLKANIRMSAKIVGQYRVETPEIPDSVIRELVVNATVHRSYISYQASYIAIYSDRIEVLTPGGLLSGLTVEKIKQGFSKIRNRSLSRVFMHLNLMDSYGMGIPKMIEDLKEAGLKEPCIEDLGDYFKITVYRKSLYEDTVSEPISHYISHMDYENLMLKKFENSPKITLSQLSEDMNLSLSTIKREVRKLQEKGKLLRYGNNRKGLWKVCKKAPDETEAKI